MIFVLWVAGHFGANLLGKLKPHLPIIIVPWLTRNTLIVVSFLFLLSIAQYLAWRTLRLKLDGPEIDRRLSVTEEPGLTVKEPHLRQQLEAGSGKPLPDHCLDLRIWNKEEIKPAGIVIECTGPIYHASAQRLFEGKDGKISALPGLGPIHLKHDCVLLKFVPNVLPIKTLLRVSLYSPQPISINRMSIAAREEMEHF